MFILRWERTEGRKAEEGSGRTLYVGLPDHKQTVATSDKSVYHGLTKAWCNCILCRIMTSRHRLSWWRRHFLTLVAGAILVLWIALYARSSAQTHAGSFFGNAIADWTGLVVTKRRAVAGAFHPHGRARQVGTGRGQYCLRVDADPRPGPAHQAPD